MSVWLVFRRSWVESQLDPGFFTKQLHVNVSYPTTVTAEGDSGCSTGTLAGAIVATFLITVLVYTVVMVAVVFLLKRRKYVT